MSATGTVAGSSSTKKNSRSKHDGESGAQRGGPRSWPERPAATASSPPSAAGDEQVAVAHHGRAEHRALQPRQASGGVRRVERVVRIAAAGRRSTSAASASAIATIPAASQRGGVTIASSTPSATQLSAESTSAAAWPPSAPRSTQASANRTRHEQRARRARAGRQPAERERGERGHGAQREVRQALRACAFGGTAPIATKPITESGGIAAQRLSRRRASAGIAGAARERDDRCPARARAGRSRARTGASCPR